MSLLLNGSLIFQTAGGPLPISMGGTGQTTRNNALNALLPVQTGQAEKMLVTDGVNVNWAPMPGSTPGGLDTQIQFNNLGAFGGLPSFTINKITGDITNTSLLSASGLYINGTSGTKQTLGLQTGGNKRWLIQTDGINEAGGNTGSNFEFLAVADNGITQTPVFTVSRASPIIDFKTTPTVNGVPMGVGTGSVSSVSVSGSNGVTVSGSPITTTGTITLGLGNITPTTITALGPITGTNLTGINTGDQTITLIGDVSGSGTGTFVTTLPTVNTSPQTNAFRKVTVNGKGLVTSTTAVTNTDITDILGFMPGKAMSAVIVTTTVQLSTSGNLYVLTNASPTTVTLPADPIADMEVWVTVANNLTTNVIARNGATIMDSASDMMLDLNNYTYKLRYLYGSWRFV